MTWKVFLHGNSSDLSLLTQRFQNEPQIVKEGDDFVLMSSKFEGIQEAKVVRETGREIFERILGTFQLNQSLFGKAYVGGVAKENEDGTQDLWVWAEPAAGRVVATGATLGNQGKRTSMSRSEKQMELADQCSIIDHLLLLWSGNIDWFTLYKIYELIEENIEEENVYKTNWTSRNKLKHFRRTANDRSAAGIKESRHYNTHNDDYDDPMSIGEAEKYIRHLSNCWLKRMKSATE